MRRLAFGLGLTASLACRPALADREYPLHGQVLAVRSDARELLIRHQDIPGFMPGMTMPFAVERAGLLEGRSPGELIRATLVVGERTAFLRVIEHVGNAPLTQADAEMAGRPAIRALEPGEQAPGLSLVNAESAALRLTELQGSAIVLTFIYLRCPLPQFCPLMDQRFAEVQRGIAAEPELRDRVRLLSISFDPAHDTPTALAAHAKRLGADPRVWTFAAVPAEHVVASAAAYGVSLTQENDGTITHNLRTFVISPDGRVAKVLNGNEWSAADLLDALRSSLNLSAPL